MKETEDELRLRKLKAETELAEQRLQASKRRWQTCQTCRGSGRYWRYTGRDGRGIYAHKKILDLCYGCGGSGGYWYYTE